MKTKGYLSVIFASALLSAPAFAQAQSLSSLAPGKPAGAHHADLATPTLLAIGVLTVIAVGAALIVSNTDSSKSSGGAATIVTTTTG